MKFEYKENAHTILPEAYNDVYMILGTELSGDIDDYIQFFTDMKNCEQFKQYKDIEIEMDSHDPFCYVKLMK